MIYLLLLMLITLLISIYIYLKDPRTLFLGLSVLLFLMMAGVAFFTSVSNYYAQIEAGGVRDFLILLVILIAFILVISPILMIVIFIFNGLQLLKREGRSLRNFMLLIMGLLLLFYPTFGNLYLHVFSHYPVMIFLYRLGTLYIFYLFFMATAYTISSFLNLLHWKKQSLDYVVVLGSGLLGDKVSPLLASRINKGIKIHQANPNSKLIMSGGQGKDEDLSEGEAMRLYALEQGIADENIIVESKARNTQENILFSKELMTDGSHFAIVSNYYHLFRALLIAKELRISCIGYGAKTRLYFTLNAYIRELVGYLYFKRRLHIMALALLTLIYTIVSLIIYLISNVL